MDIEYKGANCIVINTKKATVVIDPKLSSVGLKDFVVKDAIQLNTTEDQLVDAPQKITISGPGEYEAADVSIKGIAAIGHIDHTDVKKSTMYTIQTSETRIGVLGHVRTPLAEQQLEELGTLDILIVPVGGGGYTLDATEAIAVTRQIDPKVVIPTHYADSALSYEVTQADVGLFLKGIGVEHETVPKFKVKNGVLPETLTAVEVSRTA
jgi:L-ascorbate metabolism protein UlaG (beta-lactamase superfamily)